MRATNLLHNLGQSLWLDYITGDSARQKHTRGSLREGIPVDGQFAAVFGGPVVEGAKARCAQFSISQTEKRHPKGGVDYLGLDTVEVLVFEARRRIPYAFWRSLEASLVKSRKSCAATPAAKKPATSPIRAL